MAMILSGKDLGEKLLHQMHLKIANLQTPPGLAVILLGEHPSSLTYIKMKRKAAENVGIVPYLHHLSPATSESELCLLIQTLNEDPKVDGILVQLPLPEHIHAQNVIAAIDPDKDVDGFHPINMGKLMLGIENGLVPCTPLGIRTLLEKNGIAIAGKHAVIVGRSNIVGKPLSALLLNSHATVTVAHSKTENLKAHTLLADILIAAVGMPRFIKADMVREGAVIVDVGIHREEDSQIPQGYRIIGDVDFDEVEKKCYAISPVPKGVGPMTVAMLLHNTLISYQRRHGL